MTIHIRNAHLVPGCSDTYISYVTKKVVTSKWSCIHLLLPPHTQYVTNPLDHVKCMWIKLHQVTPKTFLSIIPRKHSVRVCARACN